LTLDSTNVLTYHYICSIYREQSEFEKSLNYSKKMQSRFPDNPQGYLNEALVFLAQNDDKKVVEVLEPISDLFPEEFAVQYLLGSSFYQLKQLQESEKFLDRSVKIAPQSIIAWHSLAIIYDNTGRFDESDKVYEKLIGQDSTDVQAMNNYAYSLAERGVRLVYALTLSEKIK